MHVELSVCLSDTLSLSLSDYFSVCMSLCTHVCLSVVCINVCVSVYRSVGILTDHKSCPTSLIQIVQILITNFLNQMTRNAKKNIKDGIQPKSARLS